MECRKIDYEEESKIQFSFDIRKYFNVISTLYYKILLEWYVIIYNVFYTINVKNAIV